jgi:hypothetical protein
MQSEEDCISLLESEQILTSNSDEKQTERAWRHWAGKNHPDKHPEDRKRYTEKFQKTSDCYDRIKSTSKKTTQTETSSKSFHETIRKFNQYFKEKKFDVPEKDTFLSCIRLLCQFYGKLKSTTFKDQDYVVLKSHLQLFIIQSIAFTIIFLVGYYIGITDDIFDHIQWMIIHEGVQIGGMMRRSKRIANQSTNDLTDDLMNEIGNTLIQGGLTKDDKEEVASQIGLLQSYVGLQGQRARQRREDQDEDYRQRRKNLELEREQFELNREKTKYEMEVLGTLMFYVLNGIGSFCFAHVTMQPIQYVVGKILKTSDWFYNLGMGEINSPNDDVILNNIAGAMNYIYKFTVAPLAQNIAKESSAIGYGIVDTEKYVFIIIMLSVFAIICLIRSIVGRIVGIRMIGGSYKNRKKYSAKRRTSVKRKSKSTKRKSKSTKRKSKTAKRKSKSTKRKSKTAKRKSKSTKRKSKKVKSKTAKRK